MRLGEFACGFVERGGNRAPRIAFAHHRLEEHRLDVPAVLVGIGEHRAQLFDAVRLDGDQAVLVAIAREVLLVSLAAGIGIQRGQLGAAVERALHRETLDLLARVACAGVGHQLGVDIGDAAGKRDRLGARIQAEEMRVRAALAVLAGVADLGVQQVRQAHVAQARGHDVRHRLRLGHRFDDRHRRMAEGQHAVTAGVVHDRTLQGDHPRAACGQGDVRVHRIVGIEIDEAGLHRLQLRFLVHRQEGGELRVGAQCGELFGSGGDRVAQFRVGRGEALDRGVVEAMGAGLAAMAAEHVEHLQVRRTSRWGVGHGSLQARAKCADSGRAR